MTVIAWKLTIVGFMLVLAGVISYPFLLGVPSIRSTAWLNIVLIITGLALASYSAYVNPTKGRIVAASGAGVLAFGFVFALFILFRLPAPDVGRVQSAMPDFELPNQDGRPIRLSSFHGQGPVFLVFYRGHW